MSGIYHDTGRQEECIVEVVPGPDDRIILSCDKPLSAEQAQQLRAHFRKAWQGSAETESILLQPGLRITFVRGTMKRCGETDGG